MLKTLRNLPVLPIEKLLPSKNLVTNMPKSLLSPPKVPALKNNRFILVEDPNMIRSNQQTPINKLLN
jgi:hypothetical protein